MPILDLDAGRHFFASQPSLPMMVYLYDSPEAAEVARQVGLDPDQLIAAFSRSLQGGLVGSATVFLAGATLSSDKLRVASAEAAVQTIALADSVSARRNLG